VLGDGSPRVLSRAAGALAALEDPRAVVPLIAALEDVDGNMRAAAAKALGSLGDQQAVGPLVSALAFPEKTATGKYVGWAAATALALLAPGDEVISARLVEMVRTAQTSREMEGAIQALRAYWTPPKEPATR
ncbi:HEAT repeat domain-containing protein, partial [bacterium]|nr:HEAT repeat domain-containing protein [bacterium]